MKAFSIHQRVIGPDSACFVIAEAGVNHNGDMAMARRLVEVACAAGADAVKFQTFSTDDLVSENAPKAEYQKRSGDARESQREMLRKLELSERDHRELMELCRQCGIQFISSPFDEGSADLLKAMGVAALKIPSGEITNLPFLAHVAALKLPLIISTGMATMEEVEVGMGVVRAGGEIPLALLHCVSAYPAAAADCNLRAMAALREKFAVPVGFSDHTLGAEVSLAAVALGATVIEKHFTLDKSLPGPDHQASLSPPELTAFISDIRSVESALGHGRKVPVEAERDTARVARKSLVAVKPIPAGTRIVPSMLAARRPGTGISPALLDRVVGRVVASEVGAGQLLAWEMFQ